MIELIKRIDELVAANGGMHFREEMYEETEKTLQQQKGDRETAEQQVYNFPFMADLLQRVILFQAMLAATQDNPNNLDRSITVPTSNITP